jgi:hypothetical protein
MMKTNLYGRKFQIIAVALVLSIFSSSCKKYLEIDPPTNQLTPILVFNNVDAVTSTIVGLYSRMISAGGGFANGSPSSITSLCGLSADEFMRITNVSGYSDFADNSLLPTTNLLEANLWNANYQYIYTANAILEGLDKSDALSSDQKKQFQGEAKFVRAFCYFYLTNLFGDVPLHLTTDYRANTTGAKSTQAQVYSQIIKDLTDAQTLLGSNYITTERVRPNKWVATALLSRVYLYSKNWIEAEKQSTLLIENTELFNLKADLNQVFLKNSSEAIWQLMPTRIGFNTNEADLFIPITTPLYVSLTDEQASSFEDGDKRKSEWVRNTIVAGRTYYYPFKYKVLASSAMSEYSMVLRLAEQYLIRAEARINLDKIELGFDDLNALRSRARPAPTISNPNPVPVLQSGVNKEAALIAVERERRSELFSEWGHRWLDLKRTNRVSAVLGTFKGTALWQPSDALYPIPQTEINANPSIIQNNGY